MSFYFRTCDSVIYCYGYLWNDSKFDEDEKFVKLLLEYDADPNISYRGYNDGRTSSFEEGYLPLMHSVGSGIEKMKLLIEYGANVNDTTTLGETAAFFSLLSERDIEYANYIIIEKSADVSKPSYSRFDENLEIYLTKLLKNLVFDLKSEEYEMKLEIIRVLSENGLDYYSTSVPERILNELKYKYPDDWEDVLKKY